MYLCRVTGSVVAPKKNETFRRAKLLVVHPVDRQGEFVGRKDMLALDPKFDAGVGDYVLVAKQGQVVHQIMSDKNIPANLIIVGVVDDWSEETA
jgi:ethanolamine utilization protein EutN